MIGNSFEWIELRDCDVIREFKKLLYDEIMEFLYPHTSLLLICCWRRHHLNSAEEPYRKKERKKRTQSDDDVKKCIESSTAWLLCEYENIVWHSEALLKIMVWNEAEYHHRKSFFFCFLLCLRGAEMSSKSIHFSILSFMKCEWIDLSAVEISIAFSWFNSKLDKVHNFKLSSLCSLK